MKIDIAKMEPALELAARNTGQAVERAMEAARKTFDQQKVQMKIQGEALTRQLENLQRSSRDFKKLHMKFNMQQHDMI